MLDVDRAHLSDAKRLLWQRYLQQDRSRDAAGADLGSGAIDRRPSGGPAPLSFGQEQLWFLAQLAPDSPAYNEPITVYLPGPLDVPALEQAFNAVITRHEAWRTTFVAVDGQPTQIIHAPSHASFTLPVRDLRGLPPVEREARALRLATWEARRPFDLERGPLVRATLARLDDADYRLFLTLHHIIMDGISIYRVFLPELRALYAAFVAGEPSPLPDLPIQYADYAHWQRRTVREESLAPQLEYWRRQLGDISPAPRLPTDRPRPEAQTFRGAQQSFALSSGLTGAFKRLSGREGVTLFITLLAAFNTLLYRYTDQDDILISTVSADRKRAETAGMLGLFLNTLVLRADLSGAPTFRELLRRVREVTLQAYEHEEAPFELLVKTLQPNRDLARNPLAQVAFSLEPPLPPLGGGWAVSQMDVDTGAAKRDLYLELDDRPEGLIGRFQYNTDLFDDATISRMIGHWRTLLAGIVADPTQRLSDLPLLTEEERRQALIEWNDTQAPYPDDACVHHLFEAQVRRTPDAVAVVYGDERLTYRELNRRANRLAHDLRARGVGAETPVGLCVERSPDMISGLLGIMKAGGAYVPLDPGYPAARLSYMLDDSGARVLVARERLRELLPEYAGEALTLDGAPDASTASNAMWDVNPAADVGPDNLAYIMYTSGSTGRPKGVLCPHRGAVNYLSFVTTTYALSQDDSILQLASLSFDASVRDILGPLIAGARVVIVPDDMAKDPRALLATMERQGVTALLSVVPTMLHALVEEACRDGARRSPQLILTSGESLPLSLCRRVREVFGAGVRVVNQYGPTECTMTSTYYAVAPEGERGAALAGRPIANTQVYILDRELQPVPIGVIGEVYIGGVGVTRGYLNKPQLTAERFIPHPYTDVPGARLYRTGDLARYRPGGAIELLGRRDHQVKLRGYRVELGEIEAVLGRHPAVREALVVAREAGENGEGNGDDGDRHGALQLVGYVVSRRGREVALGELRALLREQLPDYMAPSALIALEEWPLTPNGKVDRAALPAPGAVDRGAGHASHLFVAPETELQRQLVEIWEELLDARPIGITDNFFHLGGHSLLAVRLVDRIERACGRRVPLASLFADATIAGLSRDLERREVGEVGDTGSPLVRVQAGSAKTPFFFLHGDVEGGGFYCSRLARQLGEDQPFYALPPHGVEGGPIPPTIEAMAADYLTVVRAVQPEGPYLLGGFCNGGLVAFEMARQLRARGQAVDLLALVDTLAVDRGLRFVHTVIACLGLLTGGGRGGLLDLFLRLRYYDERWKSFTRLSPGAKARLPLEGIRWGMRTLARRSALGRGPRGVGPGLRPIVPSSAELRRDVLGVHRWVKSRYVPRRYAGRIVLFVSDQESSEYSGASMLGWRRVSGDIEIQKLPGSHLTIIKEHGTVLGAHLRAYLQRGQDRARADRTVDRELTHA